jgi:TorA-specific chaperone
MVNAGLNFVLKKNQKIKGAHVINLLSPDEQQTAALLDGIRKLSDLFWGPDIKGCGELLSGGYWHSFMELDAMLKFDPPDIVQKIETDLENFTDADSLYNYLETAYVRLFISHRDGIGAPLYESCYFGVGPGETAPLMGEPAIRMKQRFESKGLSVDSNIHEPPDHLAIELEYLYFLLSKGWENQDGALVTEAGSFAAETMLPWVLKLQKRIAIQAPDHLYFFLVSILMAVLDRIGQFEN